MGDIRKQLYDLQRQACKTQSDRYRIDLYKNMLNAGSSMNIGFNAHGSSTTRAGLEMDANADLNYIHSFNPTSSASIGTQHSWSSYPGMNAMQNSVNLGYIHTFNPTTSASININYGLETVRGNPGNGTNWFNDQIGGVGINFGKRF